MNSIVLYATGRVLPRDPLLTNDISNLVFLGAVNSVVISIKKVTFSSKFIRIPKRLSEHLSDQQEFLRLSLA